MIIYLVLLLPAGSSDLPKAWRAAFITLLFGLASDGVYMCHCCYQQRGSLLHCLSTLTSLKPSSDGGLFLLHWPWSRLHRTLSGILPYEARTFLTCTNTAAITCPAQTVPNYFTIFFSFVKLFFVNEQNKTGHT